MDVTAPTTRTEPPRRRAAAVLALVIGAALTALAVPLALTEAALLVIAQRDVASFASAVEDLRWAWLSERPALAAGQALVEAGMAPGAIPLLRRGLTAAPGRYDAWTQLAYALEAAEGPNPVAARALTLSILTGPFDLHSTSYRVDMGLRLWEAFDDWDRQAFGTLVRTQWQWGPGRLTEITVDRGAERIVRRYLSDRPEDVAEFNRRCALRDRQCQP